MNAFTIGFVKEAVNAGFSEDQAIELLKKSGVSQEITGDLDELGIKKANDFSNTFEVLKAKYGFI